jgi:hypothetical protein
MIGLTVGALGSGALVQYEPHPRSLVYLIDAAFLALCAVLVALTRDTVERTGGAAIPARPSAHSSRAAGRYARAMSSRFAPSSRMRRQTAKKSSASWSRAKTFTAIGPSGIDGVASRS